MEGPFGDAIELEGEQDFDEEEGEIATQIDEHVILSSSQSEASTANNNVEDVATPDPAPPMIHVEIASDELNKMNANQLKSELRKHGQAAAGNKSTLQERLKTCLKDKIPVKFSGENN
mmetsp:Transcript_11562/g.13430  ORF Transcript_11562/g.13430 Transcript_11562/m.13430 type:complete len:118 (-) Transcript_11562:891-1244(-)